MIAYFCSECGYESNSWAGKCPACNAWSSFVETTKLTGKKKTQTTDNRQQKTDNKKTMRLVTLRSWLVRLAETVLPQHDFYCFFKEDI